MSIEGMELRKLTTKYAGTSEDESREVIEILASHSASSDRVISVDDITKISAVLMDDLMKFKPPIEIDSPKAIKVATHGSLEPRSVTVRYENVGEESNVVPLDYKLVHLRG